MAQHDGLTVGAFDDCSDDITQFKFTDLIQEMIDRSHSVNFLEIHKGWLEIHRTEDIELANRFLSSS